MAEQANYRAGRKTLTVVRWITFAALAASMGAPASGQPQALPQPGVFGAPVVRRPVFIQPGFGPQAFWPKRVFTIPKLPPPDGETFTPWMDRQQFDAVVGVRRREKCYPIELEGKNEEGKKNVYRAIFARLPGEKYFKFMSFVGISQQRYDATVAPIKRDCYRLMYTCSFIGVRGDEQHCDIWIRTFPILVRIITTSEDDAQRVRAITLLQTTGRDDVEVLGVLLRTLQRCESGHVRAEAASALQHMHVDVPRCAGALAMALESDLDRQVRLMAAASLGKFPDAAAQSVPLLMKALESNDKTMRTTAQRSLANIYRRVGILDHLAVDRNAPRQAVAVLTKLLAIAEEPNRPAVAVNAIGVVQFPGPQRVGRGNASVLDPIQYLHAGVIQDLARLGPDAAPAVPNILATLRDGSSRTVRNAAISALPKIAPENPDVVKTLAEIMESDSTCRAACLDALIAVGPGAKAAIPAACRMLKQPQRKTLSCKLIELLGIAGADSPETVAMLLTVYKTNGDLTMRAQAAATLARVAPGAKADGRDPVEACFTIAFKQFHEAKPFAKAEAARALGMLGSRAEAAIPDLIVAAAHTSYSVQSAAVTALGQMGPAARDAVPAMVALLQEKTWRLIPPVAARALGNLGPVAKDAIPTLKECLQSPHRGLREAASEALMKIDKP